MTDTDLLDYLRRHGASTLVELECALKVDDLRETLDRLEAAGKVQRYGELRPRWMLKGERDES
jgi:site-specific recombinase